MTRQHDINTVCNEQNKHLKPFQNISKNEYHQERARDRKICESLEDAIKRSGLKDGMTISFHHAFRGGDLTLNQVMEIIAKMGFKNLTLASSSLVSTHSPAILPSLNTLKTVLLAKSIRQVYVVHWLKKFLVAY